MEASKLNEEIRELYAQYGLAMYHSQCVEKSLAILLWAMGNPQFLSATPEERKRSIDENLKKTFGSLAASLRKRVELPANLEERLVRSRRMRNWLAHNYFWERARHMLSSKGRQQMIAELKDASAFLDSLDDELMTISQAWRHAAGIPDEVVDRAMEEYLREMGSDI